MDALRVLMLVGLMMGVAWGRVVYGYSVWWVVAAGIVSIWLAARLVGGLRGADSHPDDALSPWRGFRAAKHVALDSADASNVQLTMMLTHEWDLHGEVVKLRFSGVESLTLAQMGEFTLHFDYLICDDRGAGSKKRRYLIRDRWDETVRFECDAFEELGRSEG